MEKSKVVHCYLGPYELQTIGKQANLVAPGGSRGISIAGKNPPENGLGVFWSPTELRGVEYVALGEGDVRECKPSGAARTIWGKLAGYQPEGDTVADWIWSQHTTGADPTAENGTGALVPTSRGLLELVLDGLGPIRQERFVLGEHSHSNKLRDVLRANLNEQRQETQAGKTRNPKTGQVDSETHRKFAMALCEKYRCEWEAIKPVEWDADERPKAHDTAISDAFTDTNGTALNAHNLGFAWTTSASGITIQSNQASSATAASRYGRAESDLSTDDVYSRVTLKAYTDGAVNCQTGPCTRYSSSTFTGYVARMQPYWSPDYLLISRLSSTGDPSADISTNTNCPITVGDVIQLVSDGSTHTAYLNGASKTSTSDATYSGGTRCGMFFYAPATTAVDDFQAGDWPEAAATSALPFMMHML